VKKSDPACQRAEEDCRAPTGRAAGQEYRQADPGVAAADGFAADKFAFQALEVTLDKGRIGHGPIVLLFGLILIIGRSSKYGVTRI
jgi:hypothetical protein